MKKFFLTILMISGLFIVGGTIASVAKRTRANSLSAVPIASDSPKISTSSVLREHGSYSHHLRSAFTQDATLTYFATESAKPKVLFDRTLKFSSEDSLVRYDRSTLHRSDSFLFNGQTLVRTTSQDGTKLDPKLLEGSEAAGIRFQLATFGLLPILKRLSAPTTELIDLGPTSKGHQFQARTSSGSWYFYANSDQLIVRVEVGDVSVRYSDFRTVEDVKLPFHQDVRKGDQLLYEIKFGALNLQPQFASDIFKGNLP